MATNKRISTNKNNAAQYLNDIKWRCIGPPRGGRVIAVAGDPIDDQVFYFGACAGGVWKTYDGGIYWENISDGFFTSASIGALAVSESNPNTIYVGTGESCIRGNLAHGDGVYKSTDFGKTWTNIGLKETKHIARIRIHPNNPDIVYVAAFGHAFGSNKERGVYKSIDGGVEWKQVLFKSETSGAIDLTMDPSNPDIMYAAIWEAIRKPWNFSSGGKDSGIYKTVDGGETWEEITNNQGLPNGIKGRIGVTISPAQPKRIWALIEAEEGGLYRSDDSGETWELVSANRALLQRPWYYSHVFADPNNADTVWVLNFKAWKSTDGGTNFTHISTPHGDNHELWIDPKNSNRMIEGNDGGACVSFNGGDSWSNIYNQMTSQFYHLTTDNQFPYRVYATQQDNSAISVPSRSMKGAISWNECYPVGSSESGYIAVRPDNPNIVYSGAIGSSPGGGDSLLRYDHSTDQVKIVSVWPEIGWGEGPKEHKYRFQWTYPIIISPHDPNTLYVAANIVFKSTNSGDSWEKISRDLTKGDTSKMDASGGPLTLDTTYVEHYGTIFSFTESPHQPGVYWAGSDDGLLHTSTDFGKNWIDITPEILPEWSRIDVIEISPHDPKTVYLSTTKYKFDDETPYLYKTNDHGKSWVKITDGLPSNEFTRVIREDVKVPGLLFAGTENGIYFSANSGKSWKSLQTNLPHVPITDMIVKEEEIVVSTNGRSFWILDNLNLIRQIAKFVPTKSNHLFTPSNTYRITPPMGSDGSTGMDLGSGKIYNLGIGNTGTFYEIENKDGTKHRKMLDSGENPISGVVINYLLNSTSNQEVEINILDSKKDLIVSFNSKNPDESNDQDKKLFPTKGMNQFVWDMRYPGPTALEQNKDAKNNTAGPLAPPGCYHVELITGKQNIIEKFELLQDPRICTTQKDFEQQFRLLVDIGAGITKTHATVNSIRELRNHINHWKPIITNSGNHKQVLNQVNLASEKLTEIEANLIQIGISRPGTDRWLDRWNIPGKISDKLTELISVVSSADSKPTKQAMEVFRELSITLEKQLSDFKIVQKNNIEPLNRLIRELNIDPIPLSQ